MKKVIVVGCGNLGCRHIEGLFKSNLSIAITAVDVSKSALKKCEKFCNNLKIYDSKKNINYLPLEEALTNTFDDVALCIVATTSLGRKNLIEQLKHIISSQYWIIEKPIAQSVDEMTKIFALLHDKKAFVNFARRQMIFHQKIKHYLSGLGPLNVIVSQESFDIGCNIWHFIDLMNWWTGSLPEFVDTSKLKTEWRQSKRLGFFEVDGCIMILFNDGSKLTIFSGEGIASRKTAIHFGDKGKYELDEQSGIFGTADQSVIIGKLDYQSEMSGAILDQLLMTKNCYLPSLEHSIACNQLVMKELLKHWNMCSKEPEQYLLPVS